MSEERERLLFNACTGLGNIRAVRRLIREGVNIHWKNNFCLAQAASRGHLEIVKELIEAGAVVNDIALRWSLHSEHFEVHDYLKACQRKQKLERVLG
jgi:hypothetical protein